MGEKKRVVVLGGGFCGAYVTKQLERSFDVTLIDEKDYFEFTPGILRAIVEPDHVRRIQVLHSHYTRKAEIVRGQVTSISKTEVQVDKRRYPYDYLVVSSGFRYELPFKPGDIVISTRASELRNNKRRLEKANRILIIGGGLTGVELVGEILDCYEGKEIVIIQNKECLIPRNNARCRSYVTKRFRKRGVKIHCNEELASIKENEYRTKNGMRITADIAFLCTGIKPNIGFLKRRWLATQRNQIKVNRFLQSETMSNVFAGGDISNVHEEKTAQNAEKHAKVIVKNIMRMEQNEPMVPYQSRRRPMLISLGKWRGILTYKWLIIRGPIPAFLKWFVERRTMARYRKVE